MPPTGEHASRATERQKRHQQTAAAVDVNGMGSTAILTREQSAKLTPEEQAAIAEVEAQRLRKREQLLRQIRFYRGVHAVPTFFVMAALFIMIRDDTKTVLLPFCIVALASLVHFHATGVNRRIDALVELLDPDLKRCTEGDDGRFPR